MYAVKQSPRFFFRHFFCGGRRAVSPAYSYINNHHQGNVNLSPTPINLSNVSTTGGIKGSEPNTTTSDYYNRPYYFNVFDHNLKKIDKFNHHFKNIYNNHGGPQYIDKIETIFESWDNEFSKYRGFRSPRTSITETDKGVKLLIELPGYSKENVSISFVNNILNIETTNKTTNTTTTPSSETTATVEETNSINFKKSFTLPEGIDTNQVKAVLKDGVLSVQIPKESYSKSKQVIVE